MRLIHDRFEGITDERKVGICLRAANLRTATALIGALERATLLLQSTEDETQFSNAAVEARSLSLRPDCATAQFPLSEVRRDPLVPLRRLARRRARAKVHFDGIVVIVDVSGACAR